MEDRVLVVGELNVDVIVSGLPSLPALGHEILADDLHLALGSSSAEDALRFANACGALSATGIGGTAAQPTLEQVSTFLAAMA